MFELTFAPPVVGGFALLLAFILARWVNAQSPGTEVMINIANQIEEGAKAFLKTEYRILIPFVGIFALFVAGATEYSNHGASFTGLLIAVLAGALSSALAGYLGMMVATKANVRTTQAAKTSLNEALKVSFRGGSVMGLTVTGLVLLVFSLLLIILVKVFGFEIGLAIDTAAGFSLGASSIALFARVGGGIYTKAADMAADITGKTKRDLPEDDPRNPAVIADNVGDNVGDIAGMGADLFESYVGAIVGAMVIAKTYILAFEAAGAELSGIVLPLLIPAAGTLISSGCIFLVKIKKGETPLDGLGRGEKWAAILMVGALCGLVLSMLPSEITINNHTYTNWGILLATIIGLGAGFAIGRITEYFTSDGKAPVDMIIKAAETSVSTVVLAGIGVGFLSVVPVIAVLGIAMVSAYLLGGGYAVALSAVSLLSITTIQLSIDAFGPIADNAGGIAEQARLNPEVRETTDKIDSAGNTSAAMGKGFAIGSATFTAVALFQAFMAMAKIEAVDMANVTVFVGGLFGAAVVMAFCAITIFAVQKAASAMSPIIEAELDDPDVWEYKRLPNSTACIEVATQASLKQMVVPGLLALVVPVLMGLMSELLLAGMLVGLMIFGVGMAIFMANSGGAWDNAKKGVEAKKKALVAEFGEDGYRKIKDRLVEGDMVGDPFKDTSGPSLNILLKLSVVVSMLLGPFFASMPNLF